VIRLIGGRAAAAAIACVMCTVAASGDFKTSFADGIRALDQKRWRDAERAFRAALREQPDDTGARIVINGMITKPYVPTYYLGIALYGAGDCGGALEAWRQPERLKRLLPGDDARTLDRSRQDCEQRMARLNPPPPPPSSSSLPRPSSSSVPPPPSSSVPPPPSSAPSSVPLPEIPVSSAPRPPVSSSSVPLNPVSSIRPAPSSSSSSVPAPAAATPDRLLNAARLFFRAQYAQASDALAGAQFERAGDRLQAELFRAASAYARYLTGGERDPRLRDEAAARVRGCRAMDPRFSPDPAYFSPRFVDFYRNTR
jgi:hypothetical protein